MSLEILEPGALTTVQDLGRFGYMNKGFSVSGAVDTWSMQTANLLVGNEPGEAVLEATIAGPSIRFLCSTVTAVTGADMSPALNGELCPMNQALPVHEGDVLTLGFAAKGCRAYVAFAGGMDIPKVLGSKSTNLKCGLGGFQGRALKKGDMISLVKKTGFLFHMENRIYTPGEEPFGTVMGADGIPVLRVIKGPQADCFTEKGQKTLERAVYTVTNDSNRMACKLSGEPVEFVNGGDIISDGITTGSIQVSSGGMPIVMLADHQTTGGYAKIGTVISVDIPALAQRKPGEKVRFQYVSVEAGQNLYQQRKKYLEQLKERLK